MRSYAIGDIHGHLDKLKAAHARVAADQARVGDVDAPLVHLGDLVDRGPDSAGVIEYLARAQETDPRIVVLKGNHDALFEAVLTHEPDPYASHYMSGGMGGGATIRSYGVDTDQPAEAIYAALARAVPDHHRAFLAALPYSFAYGSCFFAHAGIRPGVPFEAQTVEDLTWIRYEFLDDTRDHGALIVHGHTPVDHVEHHGNRLNLDTGAGFGGPVSAVAIEGREAWLLTDDGRVPI